VARHKEPRHLLDDLEQLTHHLGIRVRFADNCRDGYRLEKGRPTILLGHVDPFQRLSPPELADILCHEIGHFLAAPPTRRRRPDFGLLDRKRSSYWDRDEEKAGLIEFTLRRRLRIRPHRITQDQLWGLSDQVRLWWKAVEASLDTFLDRLFDPGLRWTRVLTPPRF